MEVLVINLELAIAGASPSRRGAERGIQGQVAPLEPGYGADIMS